MYFKKEAWHVTRLTKLQERSFARASARKGSTHGRLA